MDADETLMHWLIHLYANGAITYETTQWHDLPKFWRIQYNFKIMSLCLCDEIWGAARAESEVSSILRDFFSIASAFCNTYR